MANSRDVSPQPAALDERAATLQAAMLRINATLDVDTVLNEVVESARGLAGAQYGVIATVDGAGVPLDFVFSGFSSEERRALDGWPDSARLFEHLRTLPGPLRLDDLSGYVRSLGIEPAPTFGRTFQSAPMRHRGTDVGHVFLAEKADGEAFTDGDEAALLLFASQAAAAVANARAHRAERRARADLEALVETSPVGVVVFEVGTGRPMSVNREARRVVESLRPPGRPVEELLEVIACRRADGREVSLAEFPIAAQLAAGETVRAEEIVLSVPDGRSVRTLVNATPIRSADGAVESVVVTMQDLAPLDDIERMRVEFLALVGQELRAPLTVIKGSAATLLDEANLDRAEMREFHRIIAEQADHMRVLVRDLLDAGRIESGTLSVAPEPADVRQLVEDARTTFAAGGARQTITVDLPEDLPTVMADRHRIAQVLAGLLSNAARHAPEISTIGIAAVRDGAHVAVSVTDRGPGVPPERLAQLFTRHTGAGGNAGHGLGLAICRGLVEAHGGRIRAESDGPGRGTRVVFTLPLAQATPASAAAPASSATPAGQPRVLVVDDDPHALRFARNALAAGGFTPLATGDPDEIGHIVRAERPRLVVLDLVLPGTDGIELMRRLPELANMPVVFVSGYGRDATVAEALEAGAVDYIVKPFSPTELVARVRAALRRREDSAPFVLGTLSVDYGRRRAIVEGREIDLTATEFDLLAALSRDAGRVVTYETLLRTVWRGRSHASANLVRIFVRTLRRKLGDAAAEPVWIFNERGRRLPHASALTRRPGGLRRPPT